ncbi:MAG TPA: dTDP-4-dehydrorhamnose 3,5-epimerase family protein [Actinomycetota bacterium]|nr:dTDP-4-dehydrorhamnose 3,5-epimerase family protein [Actinomycetota bacterium]
MDSEPDQVVEPGIAGVRVLPLRRHEDARGWLAEVYRRAWVPEAGEAVQANVSVSRRGVLRGLHFHRRQADYWCVLSGRAFVGLFDCREGSPTRGHRAELRLSADAPRALYIPPGVAHGFYAEEDVVLLYLVDRYFTGEDEFGVAWDDPEVGIAWPARDPVLSERDRSNPPLAALADPPPFRPAGPAAEPPGPSRPAPTGPGRGP